ncbi:F-BAR domain only protein 2-like [Limulus polyphemus]|uniref:F-BAR domain only protein 2-like n=1 Tax=Limulus polyphemus TaxID=6850 RepID=A0ABM1T3Q5_LIMPO|nr:F-BAR domain only protein 2-like [Limulus polyphemus]
MPVDFRDYFWGEKNNGFDVLYHNMKYGQTASKELVDFFRERSGIEEAQSKLLTKLAKQAGSACSNGTFAPLWQVLKVSTEKLSSLHSEMVQRIQDLVKEVHKYCDEQHKKHKLVKEEESGTLEVVQSIQQTITSLSKAKETYNSRCLEVEKLRKENSSPKDFEKAELKCKKACEDYKSYVDKYSHVREEFQKKMTVSCQHFLNHPLLARKSFSSELPLCSITKSSYKFFALACITICKLPCRRLYLLPARLLRLQLGNSTLELSAIIHREIDHYLSQPSSHNVAQLPPEQAKPIRHNVDVFDNVNVVICPLKGQSVLRRQICPPLVRSALQTLHRSTMERIQVKKKLASMCMRWHFAGGGHDIDISPTPSQNVTPAAVFASSTSGSTSENNEQLSRTTFRGSKWFLKSKREKRKEKKKKKKESQCRIDDQAEAPEKDDEENARTLTVEVDDEGFTIRPHSEGKDEKEAFYSSSDADSDEEEKERKIHIEIKPLSNGAPMSASVDELRATVGTLSLSPLSQTTQSHPETLYLRLKNRRTYSSAASTPEDGPMKRSISASHPISKGDSDILSFSTPNASSASTPTGTSGRMQSPLSFGSTSIGPSADTTPTVDRYAALSELFSEAAHNSVSTSEPSQVPSNSSRVSTPTSSIGPPLSALPRPPSRRAVENSTRGRMSPSPMPRAESIGSLTSDFKTTSMPVGSSRGPSPLTIGICDTIPLAVAFQEVVHAYFKGTDETKCQVRLMGDVKVSFPAGIVQVLANNPNPASLSFRISKTGKLENILPNKQLILQDTSQSTVDSYLFEFNMPALTGLLRKQYEQAPNASYFNIDILKYHIKSLPGAKSTPLHLVAYWKCEPRTTNLRIDYKYNPSALASMTPVSNITVIVPVDGGVNDMQSKPSGTWNAENQRVIWRIPELSHRSEGAGIGSLRARFDLSTGPSTPGTLIAQFSCQGTSLSGADFELACTGYRLSLVKKQVMAGKYLCEADQTTSYA